MLSTSRIYSALVAGFLTGVCIVALAASQGSLVGAAQAEVPAASSSTIVARIIEPGQEQGSAVHSHRQLVIGLRQGAASQLGAAGSERSSEPDLLALWTLQPRS